MKEGDAMKTNLKTRRRYSMVGSDYSSQEVRVLRGFRSKL